MENLKNVLLDETEKMFVPSYLKDIQNFYYSHKNKISNITKFRSILEKLQNYAIRNNFQFRSNFTKIEKKNITNKTHAILHSNQIFHVL